MKYTLLDMVQTIASSMDSDEVNSISDSVESMQIATCVRTAYYDIISRQTIPEHSTLFNLTASGDSTKPTLMYVPSDVERVERVRYNIETVDDTDMNYTEIQYLNLQDFLDRMYQLSESEDNVGTFSHTIDSSTLDFLYVDDTAPTLYTTFDDHTLIFDSYDSEVDNTLQASKSQGYGRKNITWTMSDVFTPALDESQFALLLNEAKSLSWAELKQMAHAKSETNARRQLVRSQSSKKRADRTLSFDQLPNFGRR